MTKKHRYGKEVAPHGKPQFAQGNPALLPVHAGNPNPAQVPGGEKHKHEEFAKVTPPARNRWPKKLGDSLRKIKADWIMAVFTFVIAAAAILQLWVFLKQLEAMRIDQRAWINVKEATPYTISPNAAPSVTVSIENTGKTPAAPLAADLYIEIMRNQGEQPHYEANVMHRQMTLGMIAPNAHTEVMISRLRNDVAPRSEDELLTQDEYNDLLSGNAWYAAHGKISYIDVFGITHWTKFCFWHDMKPGTYHTGGCTAYNNIDHD